MKLVPRPIAKLAVGITAALFLVATPVSIDWHAFDLDGIDAQAKNRGGKGKSGSNGSAGTNGAGGVAGAVGGAVSGAVGAVGGAVGNAAGAVADGVSGAVGGATGSSSESSGDTDSSAASGDSGTSGSTSGSSSGSDPSADSSGSTSTADGDDAASATDGDDAASNTDGDDAAASNAAGAAASGSTSDTGDTSVAPGVAGAVSDAVDSVVDALDGDDSETAPVTNAETSVPAATDDTIAPPKASKKGGAAKAAAASRSRVTVSVRSIPVPARGNGDDKHRLVGSRSGNARATVALAPDNPMAGDLAAIEPSAGPLLPAAPTSTATTACAAADGQPQGTEVACLIPGSEDKVGTRQVAYASPDAGVEAPAADAAGNQLAPSIDGLPGRTSLYDELYGLQQVEARRYADGDVPVLIVQGIVSNMSNGQRSVPPLLAIVQDDQGRELLRWTFRAEAESLGPGGSTGFRSEMFDPEAESAKVTIVFAAAQQTQR
jgi:hypothetical protein